MLPFPHSKHKARKNESQREKGQVEESSTRLPATTAREVEREVAARGIEGLKDYWGMQGNGLILLYLTVYPQ